MKNIILILLLSSFLSFNCLAQSQYPQGIGQSSQQTMGPRKQMATIIFSGLAGAILGLSTLSFYGRPQDKLSNIAIGFAIGIISGTVYTTYLAAVRPKAYYEGYMPTSEWERLQETSIHEPSNQQNFNVGYSWDF